MIIIVCLILLVLQIVLLVKSLKKHSFKYGLLAVLEGLVSIIASILLCMYYSNLPGGGIMPGLTYFGEIIFCCVTTGACILVLYITLCCYVVVYEKSLKKKGKASANPVISILAIAFVFVAIGFFARETWDHIDKKEVVATVEGFEDVHFGSGVEQWPVFSFKVDVITYRDNYPMDDVKIGDVVDMYYYGEDGKYQLTAHQENCKWVYIPALVFGIGMFVYAHLKRRKNA